MRTTRKILIALMATAALSVAVAPTSQPSNPDQQFIMTAAQGGLLEVALGRLAVGQAGDRSVRDLGRMMVTDHSTANDRLLVIAMQENLAPPKGLSTDGQSTYDRLAALNGKPFDQAYVRAMLDDHRQDIADFQHEVDHGSDVAVKDWARSTLPVLHHHLDAVQHLADTMGK